jgi:hypothetical protein
MLALMTTQGILLRPSFTLNEKARSLKPKVESDKGWVILLTRTKADEVREMPLNDDLAALCKRVRARDKLKSEKELQEMLGYKTIATTMRLAHFSQEHKKRAINRLNGLTASRNGNCHKTVTFPKSSATAAS